MDHRDEARAILKGSSWLQGLSDSLIEPLIRHGRIVALSDGAWAQGEGDDETGLLIVIQGRVQMLCKAPGDREVLIGQAGRGYALGQTTRFGGGPRIVTVVSDGPSVVLVVSDRALGLIAAEAPQIWQAVAALLYLQMRALAQLAAEAIALPPRQRLASRLDLIHQASGANGLVRLSQTALGEMTGLTRKTVNGYLGDWAAAGIIRRRYGAIEILDLKRLRAVADS